ncbi:lytic transglycosylase domain-containing protein [Campylobacter vulpis]|uniref:lytic transglycosylase domain-containing protein n=1 Tax=Campylobacter vulpis TaxID=1655500 RepID=UPI000C15104B|nr:lytic transglycosylase domain-containing protein [Campylobacter vulpis]MBS4275639.1 lytic transglycosylase domain-containing protein [Campylobacter vulpis]MBS4306849.1 lytic transglycosylase domain-containing protein [Campylobacter vulpis]MBS4329028.1 lytic transglycosylase domain-containing protein [Campylobacter vulpis]MBS4422827.1 lytic transglycosylase domain-containing protein [Campylobacter vulpis]PHY89962.1 lytic transglycosylase [Campylobacter vulpis]
MKKFFLLAFALCYLNAAHYELETLKKYENSIAKDYYIYRLLQKKSLEKKEVQNLHSHIFRYVGVLKKELDKLAPLKPYVNSKYAKCYTYTKDTILDANATCQSVRLNSLNFIASLTPDTRKVLAKNLPNFSTLLLAFNEKNPMNYIVKKEDANAFFKYFNYSKKTDFELNANFVNKLTTQDSFKNFAQNIIIKKENAKFAESLLEVNASKVKEDTAFYLGVNALVFEEEDLAYHFFKSAYESFKQKANQDNALFWLWLIKKDEKHLKELAKSQSLNIYSLYARELTNAPFVELKVLKAPDTKSKFDMSNPFAWQELARRIRNADANELKRLEKEFKTQSTLPIYALIKEKIDKKNYFIMPYFEYIKDYDVKRQALILAIARQESRFIPTAISTSYALGTMQFMPFLANHIGHKELKIANFDQDFMFKPEIAYLFANHHLNYLEKHLNSPLYVFYAYNAGIGFTTRLLKRNDMFKEGKYEPFLSMELVPYQETRIYGKKVLANYIAYRHLLNDNIKILDIFENLIQNTQTQANKS